MDINAQVFCPNCRRFLKVTRLTGVSGVEINLKCSNCPSWGFDYKSQMVWVKSGGQGGIGYYFWGDHELLLVATKGSFLPKKVFSSVYSSPREKH